ncbi:MAG: helix-turn-helix transcriptional regulator [Clostridia bacterium]|nr:helix-turn-helix transcriptional regulator [Clostridia bacterium]
MVQRLKELRKKKNISQQQLADIIGVSQQSVNKYENHNVEPDISLLIELADFFGTSVDYLIGHSDINRKIEPVSPYDLNTDEAALIDTYRNLSAEEKESIHLIIKNYTAKK